MKRLAILFIPLLVQAASMEELQWRFAQMKPASVKDALQDMAQRWPERCPLTNSWLASLEQDHTALLARLKAGDQTACAPAEQIIQRVRDALLNNPLLDAESMLLVRRPASKLALPTNTGGIQYISAKDKGDNAILRMCNWRVAPRLETLWAPSNTAQYVGEIKLHFDANRLMFTANNEKSAYRLYELSLSTPTAPPTLLPQILDDDVDNSDGCWLADDSILFVSTAPFLGVPCVGGTSYIGHLYRWDHQDHAIRRLTFDQEHNWNPVQMQDGRVLYLRWEYSDIPHFAARILFTMNPDGTGQREHYGSNSYWPNTLFSAKPVPDHPRQFVAIVSGHHGVCRMGELILFDPSRGRKEADGVIQRIPHRGKKVEPIIRDELVDNTYPRFLYPQPLGNNYILVSCQPNPGALWGIYLVDLFDNMTLIHEEAGQALFEPTLVKTTPRPQSIQPQYAAGKPAHVKIVDIYSGPGLAGIPRGTVKQLRLVSYAFSYRHMGGETHRVGLDGPWDIKRILGTVPVEADGSAFFEVPANTPISMQPLDAQGRAVQLMRSWITVMPGELQSCSGCHEPQNAGAGAPHRIEAMARKPATITPWYGPARGFSFVREVQPVLDQYCIACHDGSKTNRPDFTHRPEVGGPLNQPPMPNLHFTPSYFALWPYVRHHTMESDLHLLTPYEFHASTSLLIQMLEAGHHGVMLTPEAWDRLTTWIDLNTPAHGTWTENAIKVDVAKYAARQQELNQRYAALTNDYEDTAFRAAWKPYAGTPQRPQETQTPPSVPVTVHVQPAPLEIRTLALSTNVTLTLTRIPAGTFTDHAGISHTIEKPFWISNREIRNSEFACFMPTHDSRIEAGDFLHFNATERGWNCNDPDQPVCRVSHQQATSFCEWLSKKTRQRIQLPSASEWEWAARAGTTMPTTWGGIADDFSKKENMADQTYRTVYYFMSHIPPIRLASTAFSDNSRVAALVGTYQPNNWKLYDMLGNVREWSRDMQLDGRVLACGGSWATRPSQATFDSRVAYPSWQPVFDVGFRIIINTE